MSYDQILMLPPGYGFDEEGGGDDPAAVSQPAASVSESAVSESTFAG